MNTEEPEIFDLGKMPERGVVPKNMHAFCVRQERFGEPKKAWQREIITVPELGPKEVLIYNMATGINYNNVWAALGYPVDVIAERQKKGEPEDFHAGGSDCAGIIWAIGSEVKNVKIGDEVVIIGQQEGATIEQSEVLQYQDIGVKAALALNVGKGIPRNYI